MSDMRGVTEVNGTKEFRCFVDGEWRMAEKNKLFDVYRPYDRGLYARVAAGGRPEATLVVDAATKAFPAWSHRRRNPRPNGRCPGQRLGAYRSRQPREFQDVIWINSHSGQRQYLF